MPRARVRLKALGGLAGLCLLASSPQASAHPHVWIAVTATFELDAEGRLGAVRQSWTFDEMYSSYAVFGLDRDGDGAYSATELAALIDEFRSSYHDDRFFSKASLDGAEAVLSDAEDLEIQVSPQGALVFSFAQRLSVPASMRGATFRLQVRDPSAFVDFLFPPEGYATVEPRTAACATARDDGQPPKAADPEALMRSLIDGTAQVATRAVTLRCQ